MALGDDALAAGMDIVEPTDDRKDGADEITKTRDYIAQKITAVLATIWPLNRGGTGATTASAARSNLGFTSGTADPSGGADGEWYAKIL